MTIKFEAAVAAAVAAMGEVDESRLVELNKVSEDCFMDVVAERGGIVGDMVHMDICQEITAELAARVLDVVGGAVKKGITDAHPSAGPLADAELENIRNVGEAAIAKFGRKKGLGKRSKSTCPRKGARNAGI